ncbi:MAG TPA: glycine cleavage system protein GcvH [Candidatus Limnocylindria bacterium]|nr:glycine cleavage system protein GcvH [Candidatus Limnocylindria bacterium]
MNVPENLRYAATHEWVRDEGDTVLIGITDHAQHELGDIVFINLPNVGDRVVTGEALADVESVKAVSDIISPVTGTVREVNEALLDHPELINADAYGAWIARVGSVSSSEGLMTAKEYRDQLDREA